MKKIAMKGLSALLLAGLLLAACQNGDSDDDEATPPTQSASEVESGATADSSSKATNVSAGNATDGVEAGEGSGDASGNVVDSETDSVTADVTTTSGGRTVQRDVTERGGVSVGDVILRDGSRVAVAELANYSVDSDNPPVAVVAYFVDGGYVAVGMPSEEKCVWAISDVADASNKLTTAIVSKIDAGDGLVFSGDVDGSDNWQELCELDAVNTQDAEMNYPAYFYANTYAEIKQLDASMCDNWYLPSVAELYEVYVHTEALNSVLKACGGSKFTAMAWSSSVYLNSKKETASVWYLKFEKGTASFDGKTGAKYGEKYVLPIRVFTE